MNRHRERYLRDLGILLLSVAAAVLLWRTGTLVRLLDAAEPIPYLSSFVAGAFFTSFLTVVPATAAIAELANRGVPLTQLALVGGLGAMVADFAIYLLLREAVAEPLLMLVQAGSGERLKQLVRRGRHRLIGTLLGAFVIASPLPDELGLLLMGLSRARWYVTALLSFLLNATGIGIIAAIAAAL